MPYGLQKTNYKIMEQSTSIENIAKALIAFQSQVETIKKDSTNPFFKSKYASLENVIEGTREPLKKNNLAFSQFPAGDNNLTTILMHSSGEFMKSSVKMFPKDNTPQGQGSAITYMRRYALSAILGLATEEDDDGNAGSKTSALKTTVAPKKAIPTKKKENSLTIKKKIADQVKELGLNMTKENAPTMIKSLTKLDLVEENYEEISKILSFTIAEQGEANKNK